jgi:hypothetical protein
MKRCLQALAAMFFISAMGAIAADRPAVTARDEGAKAAPDCSAVPPDQRTACLSRNNARFGNATPTRPVPPNAIPGEAGPPIVEHEDKRKEKGPDSRAGPR